MTSGASGHHIIPFKTYLAVLITLLIFTVITVAAARVDFGALNAYIAMAIASIKAALVMMFFMHLKYDDKSYLVIFGTGIFFLIVMFSFTQLDIVTRILQTNPVTQ